MVDDEFFDDEQELMEAAGRPAEGDAAPAAAPAAPAGDDGRPAPPPFWMVLAIAAVALALGGVVGYLLGASSALASLEALGADEVQQTYATDGGASSEGTSDALPEGHPQLDIAEDGTATLADGGSAA